MKIAIDARLYGLENAGLGRYVINLIKELVEIDSKNNYVLLLRKKYFSELKLPDNFEKILFDSKHYSFLEQIKLPNVLNKINPDLVHFPHFNVPFLYRGKYIVTIHDMLMHKQKGLSATTLNPISYFIKRLGYKLIFNNAVKNAHRIIVPSQTVKDELVNYYNINNRKVEVVYEG